MEMRTLKSKKPYPIEEERTVKLKGGETVRLRPARASDMDAILDLFRRLSKENVCSRFFRRLQAFPLSQAQRLCNVNFEDEAAFIAVTGERENEKIVGSSCYFVIPSTDIAETGYMVAPEWQGQGVGTALQECMREHAIARGVRGFLGEILKSNSKMIALAKHGGDHLEIVYEDAKSWEIIIYLNRERNSGRLRGNDSVLLGTCPEDQDVADRSGGEV